MRLHLVLVKGHECRMCNWLHAAGRHSRCDLFDMELGAVECCEYPRLAECIAAEARAREEDHLDG